MRGTAAVIQNMYGEVAKLVGLPLPDCHCMQRLMRSFSSALRHITSPLTLDTKDVPLTNIRSNSKVMGARNQRKAFPYYTQLYISRV